MYFYSYQPECSREVGQFKSDFHVVRLIFSFCNRILEAFYLGTDTVHLAALTNLLKTLSLSHLLLSHVCVLPLLTTTYDVPDCESVIVMPVVSGPSSVSQHHPALLFAQGQVH